MSENEWSPSVLLATRMLTTDILSQTSPLKLNPNLIEELNQIDDMVKLVGGRLISRQAVAIAVVNWQKRHPGLKAYNRD